MAMKIWKQFGSVQQEEAASKKGREELNHNNHLSRVKYMTEVT